jgi:hypothetical protein
LKTDCIAAADKTRISAASAEFDPPSSTGISVAAATTGAAIDRINVLRSIEESPFEKKASNNSVDGREVFAGGMLQVQLRASR